jgi:flagellar biosynthesis protein FlhA
MDLLKRIQKYITSNSDLLIAASILLIVFVIILPLPEFLLDILLTINISLAILILLLTVFTKHVLEMSIFPSLLLITTLFRLSLNVSSTKLILGTGSAGKVVESFGEFVTRGDYIVGAIIFIIIIIVQFLVITNGAGRVAEVTARFTLDAMPGKQMSIDADLGAGLISEEEAVSRRTILQQEAEFYGAMDGASKFVKGDAIAGIIIVLINFIAGLVIGMTRGGVDANTAISQYGILTIGDGLVSQIPALLISVSSGILITKVNTNTAIGEDFADQLFSSSKVMYMISGTLIVMAITPGMPTVSFGSIAIIAGVAGYLINESDKNKLVLEEEVPIVEDYVPTPEETQAKVIESVRVEPMEIEIGLGLISLTSAKTSEDLFDRIVTVRKQIASELGLIIKPIRLKDNMYLEQNTYTLKIHGDKVSEGQLFPNEFLVMNPNGNEINLPGRKVIEPVFGLDAMWVPSSQKTNAESMGYTVIDAVTVLITHLKEVIKIHGHQLITSQEVNMVLEVLKEDNDVLINEVIPSIISVSLFTKLLKNLLREGVPINNMIKILETVAENSRVVQDLETLTEFVRAALSRTIVSKYLNSQGGLNVVTLNHTIEKMIADNAQKTFLGTIAMIAPDVNTQILQQVSQLTEKAAMMQEEAVIVTSPQVRSMFKKVVEIPFPHLGVLSLNEIPNDININVIGMVNLNDS